VHQLEIKALKFSSFTIWTDTENSRGSKTASVCIFLTNNKLLT